MSGEGTRDHGLGVISPSPTVGQKTNFAPLSLGDGGAFERRIDVCWFL